jgi:hypothetical protein
MGNSNGQVKVQSLAVGTMKGQIADRKYIPMLGHRIYSISKEHEKQLGENKEGRG